MAKFDSRSELGEANSCIRALLVGLARHVTALLRMLRVVADLACSDFAGRQAQTEDVPQFTTTIRRERLVILSGSWMSL